MRHEAPAGDQFLFVRSDGQRIDVRFVDPDAPQGGETEPAGGGAAPDVATIALDGIGSAEEFAVLGQRRLALDQHVASAAWQERKAAALAATAEVDFWTSPARLAVHRRPSHGSFSRASSTAALIASSVPSLPRRRGAAWHAQRPGRAHRLGSRVPRSCGPFRETLGHSVLERLRTVIARVEGAAADGFGWALARHRREIGHGPAVMSRRLGLLGDDRGPPHPSR